jgi:hypothetical protein
MDLLPILLLILAVAAVAVVLSGALCAKRASDQVLTQYATMLQDARDRARAAGPSDWS